MMTRNIIIICLFLSIMYSFAHAEFYYIDYANTEGTSSDQNNGTSPDKPWLHCPGDIKYVGTVSLQTGDTIYFKRGVIPIRSTHYIRFSQ